MASALLACPIGLNLYRGNIMAIATKSTKAKQQPANKPAPNGLAAIAAQVATATTATPTAAVPASIAVLASINKVANTGSGNLPAHYSNHANSVVTLTPKGAAAAALQRRINANAPGGPCPFLLALYTAAQKGQTLAQCWPGHIAGHQQQGRGKGGYTAAQALAYYVKSTGWFTLVAPK